MRASNILLTVAVATSSSIAAWQFCELRDARAMNERLAKQLEQSSIPSRHSSAASLDPGRTADAAFSGAATASVAPAAAQVSTEAQRTPGDWEADQARLMRDPKYREAFRARQRLAYAPRRENLIRLLGLTPAQADAVIDVQLDAEAQHNELAGMNGDSEEARVEQQVRLEALDQHLQDQLRSMLGEDKRARLQSYMESRQTRMQVDQFRTELTESNALRDDQVEPLISALHVERAKMLSDMSEFQKALMPTATSDANWMQRQSASEVEIIKSMNERMRLAASSILTSAQLKVLDAMLARDLERISAQERLNSIQLKLDRAAAATAAN